MYVHVYAHVYVHVRGRGYGYVDVYVYVYDAIVRIGASKKMHIPRQGSRHLVEIHTCGKNKNGAAGSPPRPNSRNQHFIFIF